MADKLTPQKRAERVLQSQGYPMGRTFPPEVLEALATFCSETGELSADTRDGSKAIIDEYHDGLKAAVDSPPSEKHDG